MYNTNVTLLRRAIDNLCSNLPKEHEDRVKSLRASVIRDEKGRTAAHATASVTIQFYGRAEMDDLGDE